MDMKEVAKAMQCIEFVLSSIKNEDRLNDGEIELAHEKAKQIMEQYLLPKGAFQE